MNKQSSRKGIKRFGQFFVLSALLLLSSVSFTHAATKTDGTNATPTAINYVGVTNAGIVFNVKYDNPQGAKFDLIVRNADGDVFLRKQFNEKNFEKNIVLSKEAGDAHLIFSISSPGVKYDQSFDINTKSTVVEDILVTPVTI